MRYLRLTRLAVAASGEKRFRLLSLLEGCSEVETDCTCRLAGGTLETVLQTHLLSRNLRYAHHDKREVKEPLDHVVVSILVVISQLIARSRLVACIRINKLNSAQELRV